MQFFLLSFQAIIFMEAYLKENIIYQSIVLLVFVYVKCIKFVACMLFFVFQSLWGC